MTAPNNNITSKTQAWGSFGINNIWEARVAHNALVTWNLQVNSNTPWGNVQLWTTKVWTPPVTPPPVIPTPPPANPTPVKSIYNITGKPDIPETAPTPATPTPTPTPTTPTPATPTTPAPISTAWITYSPDKVPYHALNVLSTAQTFQWQNWHQYQTQRMNDNTLVTIDTATGQPVTWKYTDAERQSIHDSLTWGTNWQPAWQVAKTSNDYFQWIQSWQIASPTEQGTVEYQQAKNRSTTLSKYSSMWVGDLSASISKWDLLPWTQEYKDLQASNPQIVKDAEFMNTVNAKNGTWNTDSNATLEAITKNLVAMMQPADVKTYQDRLTSDPQIQSLHKDLIVSANNLATLKDEMDYAREDIRKDAWGYTMTQWYVDALYSERTRELWRQYNIGMAQYNTQAGQIKDISDNIKYQMESDRQQQTTNLNKFQAAFWDYANLTAWDRAIALQKQQAILQNWDMNSKDPFLQARWINTALDSLYKNYPIPWMESQTSTLQKVKNMVAWWMTAPQALQSVEDGIRNSDSYKWYVEAQTNKLLAEKWKSASISTTTKDMYWNATTVSTPVFYSTSGADWFKAIDINWKPLSSQWAADAQAQLWRATQWTQWTKSPSLFAWELVQNPTSIDAFSKQTPQQCWTFVNDYLTQVTWVRWLMDNSLASKEAVINSIWVSKTPVPGGLFVLNTGSETWHTWVVKSVNTDNGTVNVLEANRANLETWTVPAEWTYAINTKWMAFSQAPTDKQTSINTLMWTMWGTGNWLWKIKTWARNDLTNKYWVNPVDIDPAVEASKYFSKTDVLTPFEHMNSAYALIQKLPNWETPIWQKVVDELLQAIGSPKVANVDLANNLLWTEIAWAYLQKTWGERTNITDKLWKQTKDVMLSNLAVSQSFMTDKVKSMNISYKKVFNIDNPKTQQIEATLPPDLAKWLHTDNASLNPYTKTWSGTTDTGGTTPTWNKTWTDWKKYNW